MWVCKAWEDGVDGWYMVGISADQIRASIGGREWDKCTRDRNTNRELGGTAEWAKKGCGNGKE